jgi:hypothetical protein
MQPQFGKGFAILELELFDRWAGLFAEVAFAGIQVLSEVSASGLVTPVRV